MNRKLALIIPVVIFLLLGGYFILPFPDQHSQTSSHSNTRHRPPPAVTAMQVKTENWPLQIEAVGSLNAKQGILVKATLPGPITKLAFHSHQQVAAGQLLLEIYPNELLHLLEESKRKLPNATLQLRRQEQLFQAGNSSEQALDQAKTRLSVLKATIAAQQAKYKLAAIHAPFAGRLGLRRVSLGDYVQPGTPIVGLYDLQHLRVDFPIPQQYLSALHRGDPVHFTTDAFPGKTFQATVESFDSHVDKKSRTLQVRARLNKANESLLPGMYVKVLLTLKQKQAILTIPQTAINYSLYGDSVFKLVDGLAVKVPIETGRRKAQFIEVTHGLNAGDHVIVSGQEKIQAPGKVRLVHQPKLNHASTTPSNKPISSGDPISR